ncbi:hypothetical protein ACIHFC_33265 [Streptomyces sp. NPDC052013]|uniref:hypothetical protein n=1 Tax=Streptomyces sp. NPDC052013 TaxID=3365679 RepID=UPI0037D92EC3
MEQVLGDRFRADRRIADLIRHAKPCGIVPGVACPDDGPEFAALENQVRAALKETPQEAPSGPQRRRPMCDGWQADHHLTLTPINEGYSTNMTTTQRILDLAAAAPASHGEALALILREANNLYQRGLHDLRQEVAARLRGLATADLMSAAETAGIPCDASQDRDEVILLLALAEWEMTPAAMAYAEMAEAAARRGISLIPEE